MSRAVYVAPLQALATERLADWATRFGEGLGARVLELTGDPATDTRLLGEVHFHSTLPCAMLHFLRAITLLEQL